MFMKKSVATWEEYSSDENYLRARAQELMNQVEDGLISPLNTQNSICDRVIP
jgi:hypothetical protein